MKVIYHNFWSEDANNIWFTKFVFYHLNGLDKQINFCSVFGDKNRISSIHNPIVFFSGENLLSNPVNQHFIEYKDYLLDKMDLSLGFDCRSESNYIRFPLWILYLTRVKNEIIPFSSYQNLKNLIDYLNNPFHRANTRNKFASLIASHDVNGIRENFINLFSDISVIESAGRFLNNTDELQTKFNDDKLAYLRQFRFNICPENASEYGYVTEKPFEAIQAGCIPIYWGKQRFTARA